MEGNTKDDADTAAAVVADAAAAVVFVHVVVDFFGDGGGVMFCVVVFACWCVFASTVGCETCSSSHFDETSLGAKIACVRHFTVCGGMHARSVGVGWFFVRVLRRVRIPFSVVCLLPLLAVLVSVVSA